MTTLKYKDWKGNEIKAGDTVFLIRVFEVKWSNFFHLLPLPDKTKPCWVRIATFKVTEYKKGNEKLFRYLGRNGYDESKVYEASENSNDFRHGTNSELCILCIEGISDNELDYILHTTNITSST